MNPAQVEQAGPPRVTALILSRNSGEVLQRCLEALERSEQREKLEILVVDNGSEDNSAEIPTQFPEVQTLRLPKDFGRTKATNIGLRTAKGDFIFFLPAHVEVEPDTIVKLADRLEATDAVGAVCPLLPQWHRFPSPDALIHACRSGSLPEPQAITAEAAELAIEYAPDAPMMVRRLFLRGMNYLDERYGDAWSDLELCWQLRNAGKAILVLPQVHVKYGPTPVRDHDAVHTADCIGGAAGYMSKHFGTGAGLKFRTSAILSALGRGQLGVVSSLMSGQKIDGTHLP
jgi:GT2 family glycosyltransferase